MKMIKYSVSIFTRVKPTTYNKWNIALEKVIVLDIRGKYNQEM